MIRTAIVDDEPMARSRIRGLLSAHQDFHVVAEAGHGAAAVRLIRQREPQLVFLDVQMPEIDGFEVIAQCRRPPAVVFVTAFDTYAVRAFDLAAVDYLLKPFDDLRFAEVLRRARQRICVPCAPAPPGATKLIARSHGSIQIVPLERVDWIEAAGDYAVVHAGARSVILQEPLSALSRRLPEVFARIHRSTLVRLDRISEIVPGLRGDGVIVLQDGTRLRFSRRFRHALDRHLRTP